MVMELCEQYTLYDRIINSNGGLCEGESASIMKQLLNAIAHCHRFNIVHRDIKPDNILFDSRNRVKLADFGSADWLGEVGTISGVVGTPYYVAPEVVMGREYNEKSDVWSAGVVLYVMLAGIPPFYGETVEEIFEAVIRGNLRFPPKLFRTVSSSAKDLLRKMICRDVSRRFSAEQALSKLSISIFLNYSSLSWILTLVVKLTLCSSYRAPMDCKRRRDNFSGLICPQ